MWMISQGRGNSIRMILTIGVIGYLFVKKSSFVEAAPEDED
ncbi:MAG: hypothetical protein ABEK04_00365 [Candidatus Nanohalobium sp.]